MARTANDSIKVGENVEVQFQADGRVAVVFDPNIDLGLSGSGKSHRIASSLGNVTLPNGVTIGFNAYRRNTGR